ncbi:MAG: DUF1611 domain-containing protein [Gemmatimonadaceae bacterium]|nr:DUF1611 domain-containing protein [Gemmatimonadaceae bacterium]
MPNSRRFLILAEGSFGPLSSKTANACIRYCEHEVVAVLDSTSAGRTAQSVLGFSGDIPVVASWDQGMALQPKALLIGIAPAGGQFPDAWRPIVAAALRSGLDVWSGLHNLLGDDPEFASLARASGATIRDLRRAPSSLDVGTGRVQQLSQTIILTVGTDCNIGKMTTQLQVQGAVRALGPKVHFAATGQTGILIEGRGIAVDAVVADFIAGAAEALTLEAAEGAEIVLVEGQGSLLHPSYSGVTLGLMHGSLPHAMVLCGQPSRTTIHRNDWVPIPPLRDVIALYEHSMRGVRPSPVIALALNTYDLDDASARRAIADAEKETGLPCSDPVRFSGQPIAEAIVRFHRTRKGSAVRSV